MKVRYLIMVEHFDFYAGDCGEHVWRQHADLVFISQENAEETLALISQGLQAASKTYAIARVIPDPI